mgnify:CR=1 FL=1
MHYVYLVTPFITWLVTGCLKFIINSIRERKFAFSLIGYGGMPSNHSAIVASMLTLVGVREGLGPIFGVALTLAFIVILDASSLRRQIGKQAQAINLMIQENQINIPKLRERIGHSRPEIIVGCLVGVVVGLCMAQLN